MSEHRNLWKALDQIKDQDWVMYKRGTIRNTKNQCPLCALADHVAQTELGYLGAYDQALAEIGFDYDGREARQIADAADFYYVAQRQKLLDILNPTMV